MLKTSEVGLYTERTDRLNYTTIAYGVSLTIKRSFREVVKTTMLEQDPPNHKIDGGLC